MSFSIIDLILNASVVVQLVIFLLLLASIFSWMVIFERWVYLSKSNQELSDMIKEYSNLDSNSEINMYWGLMTPEEGDEMISYFTSI